MTRYLRKTRNNLDEIYSGAKKQFLSGARRTHRSIQHHPFPAIAIATGAGLILGVLATRYQCSRD